MAAYTKDIVINAPPEKVFEYVGDLTHHSEWSKFRMVVTPVGDGPVAVGKTYKHVGHMFGADNHDEVKITDYTPSSRIAWESSSKSGNFRSYIELKPEGSGTRVTKSWEITKAGLQLKIFAPVVAMTQPKTLTEDLQKIKAHVEG